MSHHEEEGARFGYDGELLAEDIRKGFYELIKHQHTFAPTDTAGLYQCACGQRGIVELVTVGEPSDGR